MTESFIPQVNGVANTVRHVVHELSAHGHEALVVAPGPGPSQHDGTPVARVRSVGLPGYRTFPIGLPDPVIRRSLTRFRPDVVHLASPIALGAMGLHTARRLGIPTVAVFQTDVAGFARQYGVRAETVLDRWVGHLHRRVDRTLVPSTCSLAQLAALDVPELHLWRRGVDLALFGPDRRSQDLAASWAGEKGHLTVGYVGRLAPEKQIHRLATLADLPGVRVIVIGDGPARQQLRHQLPGAVFTGMLHGPDLAAAFASLDVFVHTGDAETFCQTIQEAQASGTPVVAPAAGGPLDLVESGVNGLLFDPHDPTSLRSCVATLQRSPDLRRRLADQGILDVAERTWARVTLELVDHYRCVIASVPAAA